MPLAEARATLPTLTVPERAEARPLDPAYLRNQLALYDTERLLEPDEPARVGAAGVRGGAVAERLGDVGGAIERYEAALEADPTHAPRCAACAACASPTGKREPVLGDARARASSEASRGERRALHALERRAARSRAAIATSRARRYERS